MANKLRESTGAGRLLCEPYLTLCLSERVLRGNALEQTTANPRATQMSCDGYPAPSCETQVPLFHKAPHWLPSPPN